MKLFIILFSFLVVLLSLIAILFIKNRKKALTAGIITVIFYGLLGFLSFQYVTNHQFRMFIDLRFYPAKEHMLNLSNESPLPLPPETIFTYRGAYNSCTYYSKKKPEEILEYFKKLGDISEQQGNNEVNYKLIYIDYCYSITLRNADLGKGTYLWVENIQQN